MAPKLSRRKPASAGVLKKPAAQRQAALTVTCEKAHLEFDSVVAGGEKFGGLRSRAHFEQLAAQGDPDVHSLLLSGVQPGLSPACVATYDVPARKLVLRATPTSMHADRARFLGR